MEIVTKIAIHRFGGFSSKIFLVCVTTVKSAGGAGGMVEQSGAAPGSRYSERRMTQDGQRKVCVSCGWHTG